MRILYYDCFSGISGDMNLGAMIDLGMPEDHLTTELAKLHLEDEYTLSFKKGKKKEITGTKVDVILTNEEPPHDHSHHEEHTHGGHDHHVHRHLSDIQELIDQSDLSKRVKYNSKDMFMRLAEAEAKIHGTSIDKVIFHEVGAIDSIVDVIGAAIAFDYFKADMILSSSVQVGGGFVKCAHGMIPVPAPSTLEILKGIPVKSGIVQFETTTPTGAAILAANVTQFTDEISFPIQKIGYGLGTKDFDIPNALRVYLIETQDMNQTEEQYLLETNIDDMNPELYGYVEEKLFENGALDVFKTPIIMKKGRPAVKLSVLVNGSNEKKVTDILFQETTSLGLRKFNVEKVMLQREFITLDTKYGTVSVKISYLSNANKKYKAEYEDCKKIAFANDVSIMEVYREVDRLMQENL